VVATDDTYLARWSATTNYGTVNILRARYAGATEEFSSLVRFDLASIPAGATVQSVKLNLTVTSRTAETWLDLDVFQVLRSWTEGGATWNVAQSGTAWTAAGCNGTGADRADTPAATMRIDQASGAVEITLPASLVAGWLADPATNQGLLLRPKLNTGGATMTYAFASAEHGPAGWRPKLSVTYTTPSGMLGPAEGLLAALPHGVALPVAWTVTSRRAEPDAPVVIACVPDGQKRISCY
jgi:hypothetical protein